MIICYTVPEIWCVTHETAIFQNFNQVNFYQLFNNIFFETTKQIFTHDFQSSATTQNC